MENSNTLFISQITLASLVFSKHLRNIEMVFETVTNTRKSLSFVFIFNQKRGEAGYEEFKSEKIKKETDYK